MATKTLTITEDAYGLLKQYKAEEESFSEEILRLLSKKRKKNLSAFFGILSDNDGKAMLKDLEKIKRANIQLLQENLRV